MRLAQVVTYGLLLFAVVAGTVILTSRTAIEKLVGAGVLPRLFLNLVPVLTVAARALGVVLVAIGSIQLGINTGIISYEWISRFGFSLLLIILGVLLLVVTTRRTERG